MFGIVPSDEEGMKELRKIAAPQIERMIRLAVSTCWMVLPAERQNADELEREIRGVVDRAIQDFRDSRTV